MNSYNKLKDTFKQLSELTDIQYLMMWDESVMMPEGGGEARGNALATLNGLSQKLLSHSKNKKLLDSAKLIEDLPLWDSSNLLLMEKKYLRAKCLPIKLTEKLTKESMACEQAWRKLRAQNNWREFLPYFKRNFKLVKESTERQADAMGLSPYDALLDNYAPGFNQVSIDKIFAGLKQSLPTLIQKVINKQASEHIKIPEGNFAIDKQKQLGIKVMKALQFDFHHGRLDVSHHPFCSGSPTDVRMTTRYVENEFISSLLGICHETGHGLYEQGLPREWINQPVGRVNSMAMHESQSLLIEMQLCRSLAFYEFLLPEIQSLFGSQEAFTAENICRLVTSVKPSLIRVDADEVTYPLHIVLRYELEKRLFNNEINVSDLPAYWDELMKQYLGISTKGNYKDGVMQDVHWPSGAFGYFPAYTLGRLIAAQLFSTFITAHPDFFESVKQGNFQALNEWLSKNIYSQASSLKTDDLLLKVTGKTLDSSYFIKHIEDRYL